MQPDQATFLRDYYLQSLDSEFKTTAKVIRAIPDDQRDYRPDPKARTAFELAWHIATADIWFLDGIAKAEFGGDDIPVPTDKTVEEVAAWYETTVAAKVEEVMALSAEQLLKPTPFFGMFNYPAVSYLGFMTNHTVHHRGQLATYLRPMGAKCPSIYGGSADEPFDVAASA